MFIRILLFDFIFFVFALFSFPKFLLRSKQAEDGNRYWNERWGKFEPEILSRIQKNKKQGKKLIWIHAVSVGEVLSLKVFIHQLKQQFPESLVLISTTTPTGYKVAESLDCILIYFPLDFSFVIRRVLKALKPDLILLAEKEIWPNFVQLAHQQNIVVGIVNGRMSEDSLRGYQKVGFLMKPIFNSVNFCLVQSELDFKRFAQLITEEKVKLMGNMKYDQIISGISSVSNSNEMKTSLGFSLGDQILIAGSTHEKEEKFLLEAFVSLKKEFPNLRLLLVPRHPERAEVISEEVTRVGLKPKLFSCAVSPISAEDILIVDQIGKLKDLYLMSDIVFVGGSLIHHGGQNPIEPAYYEKPILTGPHVYNFHDVYQQLAMNDAVQMISDHSLLETRLRYLLKDKKRQMELGRNAKAVVERLQGSSQKHVEWIEKFVSQPQFVEKV